MADLVDQVTTIRAIPWPDAQRSARLHFLTPDTHRGYLDICRKQSLVPPPKIDDFKVVFTPLHGVGHLTAMEILVEQGFRVLPVAEQMAPDGQFPNVTKTPNPENPDSMDRAAALARDKHADLVLATDPDRLGAMAPDRDGTWRVITGNEIAALLTHFKLNKLAQSGRLPSSPIVIRTEVTTSLVTRIARHFRAQVVDDLLVGFKYIADVLAHLEREGRYGDIEGTPADFIIAVEESHGAMLTTAIRDKDAGASALLMAELALDQKRKGKTVIDYLDGLYRQFGYFRNEGVSVYMQGIEGRQQMIALLESLRAEPLRHVAGLALTHFEDLRDPDGKFGPLRGATDAASRNVLLFRYGENVRVALRPSGTEPKAKVYLEVSTPPCTDAWAKTCADAEACMKGVSEEFVRLALAWVGK